MLQACLLGREALLHFQSPPLPHNVAASPILLQNLAPNTTLIPGVKGHQPTCKTDFAAVGGFTQKVL